MPIYSMTGYAAACTTPAGSAENAETEKPDLQIEIRSVNNRFLDLSFRLPEEIRASEPQLRALISSHVRRGKVETRVTFGHASDQTPTQVSIPLLKNLANTSDIVRNWLPDVRPLSIAEILRLSQTPVLFKDIQAPLLALAEQTLQQFLQAREREGAKLGQSLIDRIGQLRYLAAQAQPLIPQVVEQQRQRFLERWQTIMQSANAQQGVISEQTAQERALMEAATFAMRIDVAEELTRVASHLDEIERLIKKGGEIGKRLDFLIQELHREANTLGSKSPVIELTRISVEMKVLIEQMREQVQNIE